MLLNILKTLLSTKTRKLSAVVVVVGVAAITINSGSESSPAQDNSNTMDLVLSEDWADIPTDLDFGEVPPGPTISTTDNPDIFVFELGDPSSFEPPPRELSLPETVVGDFANTKDWNGLTAYFAGKLISYDPCHDGRVSDQYSNLSDAFKLKASNVYNDVERYREYGQEDELRNAEEELTKARINVIKAFFNAAGNVEYPGEGFNAALADFMFNASELDNVWEQIYAKLDGAKQKEFLDALDLSSIDDDGGVLNPLDEIGGIHAVSIDYIESLVDPESQRSDRDFDFDRLEKIVEAGAPEFYGVFNVLGQVAEFQIKANGKSCEDYSSRYADKEYDPGSIDLEFQLPQYR